MGFNPAGGRIGSPGNNRRKEGSGNYRTPLILPSWAPRAVTVRWRPRSPPGHRARSPLSRPTEPRRGTAAGPAPSGTATSTTVLPEIGPATITGRIVADGATGPKHRLPHPRTDPMAGPSRSTVVDVLRPVVGMEGQDAEGERADERFEHGNHVVLGDPRNRRKLLVLRHFVDHVDHVGPLLSVTVAAVDGVDAHEARPALRPGSAPRPIGDGAARVVRNVVLAFRYARRPRKL